MIRLSLFTSARDGIAKVHEMPWEDFCRTLGPHRPHIGTKEELPAFSPAEFMPGLPRLAKNVLRVWFGVLDLDKISGPRLAEIMRAIDGLDAVVYTTWSHPKHYPLGNWCLRVCIRLSRPIEVAEWSTFWPALLNRCKAPSDPQCKDPGRIYFGPFYPPGTSGQALDYHVFHGEPLDVSKLPITEAFAPPVQATERISRERLVALARSWKRSRNETRSYLGECLSRIAKGEVFAEPGTVDNHVFQICQDMVKEWPNADPKVLSEYFAQSLQLMNGSPGYVEEIQRKIERAQAEQGAEVVARQMAQLSELKLRITEAFAGTEPGRDWPYTEAELDDMARTIARDELRKRWIIQKGAAYWILAPGGYSPPYTDKDVLSAAIRDLAPARSAGVELWSEEGERKTIGQLMNEYGSVAVDYFVDLRAQVSRYDGATKVFTEASCPLRALEPTHDPEVEAWLRALAGPLAADLMNWIALITELDSTCAALLLTGPPDTGKGLLAHGLSRLFATTQPTSLEQVMGNFNSALKKCPLVFADEAIPTTFKGEGRTTELREVIAAKSRPYKQKHIPDTSILGAIRIIIAANSENVLAFKEDLGPDDIHAIGERIFHVKIPKVIINGVETAPARDFLRGVKATTFVTEDRIAKHALWLRDHYPIQREGRFLIRAGGDEMIRNLSIKGVIRSAVCQWLLAYLMNPAPLDARGDYGVRIRDGQLLVRSEVVLENWEVYVQNENAPRLGLLAQAITNLSTGERPHIARPKGKPLHYRVIDRASLCAWAASTEFATREDIDKALSLNTEARPLALRGINAPN